MKTIFPKLICLLWVASTLNSCSDSKDDDECDPNDKESPCYTDPTTGNENNTLLLTQFKVNGKIVESYQYNDQNLLIAVRFSDTEAGFDISRDNSGRLIRLDHIEPDGNANLREDYTYEAGDKPVSGSLYDPNDDSDPITIRYTYAANTVSETFISEDDEGSVTNTYTFDDKGNLTVANMVSTNSIIENSDYDDMNGHFSCFPWPWKISAVNNVQAVKTTSSGVVTDQIFEYTYNEEGYPEKAEVYNRGSDVVVQTREYTYKKAN